MSEPEITNPEKTEKPKNPKRVEQGKRLAAISREAKERKRQQQEEFLESAENEGTEGTEGRAATEGTEGTEEWNKLFWGIGLIGAAFLAYKIFLNSNTREATRDEDEFPEMRKVTVDSEEPEEDKGKANRTLHDGLRGLK